MALLPGEAAVASLSTSISPVMATVKILSAEQSVSTLLDRDNVAALRVALELGLPAFEGKFAAPATVPFEYFQRLELLLPEPRRSEFMEAAIEFCDYNRDVQDLIALANQVGGPGYLDRAVPELEGCAKALRTIVPLLPQ